MLTSRSALPSMLLTSKSAQRPMVPTSRSALVRLRAHLVGGVQVLSKST